MATPQPHNAPDDSEALENAIVGVAAAMADPSRVKMLSALMDGRAWTATELSAVTDVAPSTASAHLNRLITSGLIVCVAQGRHRYYRLTGSDIATLIENMMGVSWRRIAAPASTTPTSLRSARTCYDIWPVRLRCRSMPQWRNRAGSRRKAALSPCWVCSSLRRCRLICHSPDAAEPAVAVSTGVSAGSISAATRVQRC